MAIQYAIFAPPYYDGFELKNVVTFIEQYDLLRKHYNIKHKMINTAEFGDVLVFYTKRVPSAKQINKYAEKHLYGEEE